MLTASTFFLDEFLPLRGLKHFLCILLLFLSISGGARNGEKKQKYTQRVERQRRENTEAMSIEQSLKGSRTSPHSSDEL